jgi:nicotinamide mononucleotide (NMN) deamidase PncC
VGTVWIGRAGPDGSEALERVFQFDRQRNRQVTVQVAFDGLRRTLLGLPEREAPGWLNLREQGKR